MERPFLRVTLVHEQKDFLFFFAVISILIVFLLYKENQITQKTFKKF